LVDGAGSRSTSRAAERLPSDGDILHAYALGQPAVVQEEDDMLMIVGPNRSGTELLEVGVISWHGMDAIAHAMPARPKFFFPQYRW
jgi:hypothetical protein